MGRRERLERRLERRQEWAAKAAGFFWCGGCWGGRTVAIPAEVLALAAVQS